MSVEQSNALTSIRIYNFQTSSGPRSRSRSRSIPCFQTAHPTSIPKLFATATRASSPPNSVFDYDVAIRQVHAAEAAGRSGRLRSQAIRFRTSVGDRARRGESSRYPSFIKRGSRKMESVLCCSTLRVLRLRHAGHFFQLRLSLLDRGVAYAIAHIRGGDEMGEQWREDGRMMKKKNTFTDFVDCAKFLIGEKWTSPSRLMIEGGSAGGMLMGAVVNMNPELFRAVHLGAFRRCVKRHARRLSPLTSGEWIEWGIRRKTRTPSIT